MQLIENITITKFDSERELVSYPNGHLLVNSHTANLLHCLKQNPSIEEAHKKFCASQNIVLSFYDFENIVRQKLDAYGLLKRENSFSVRKKKSYLKLKIEFLPTHYAASVAYLFSWLFIPPVFWTCFIAGIAINSFYGVFAMKNTSTYQNFWIAFPLVGLSALLHEFGHISASNFFGAKHGGIGFGFYFIWPVVYSDLTGIWELEKKKRVIINLGGIYFEYVYSSILIFFSIIMGWNILGVIAIVIAIKATLQLNPFLRFDGYWILCDFLSQPNLMGRASSALKEQFRLFFNSFFNSSNNMEIKQSNYFVLLYGVVNAAIGFVFVTIVFVGYTQQVLLFPKNSFELFMNIIRGENFLSNLSLSYLVTLSFYIMLFIRVKNVISEKLFSRKKHLRIINFLRRKHS